MASTDTKRGGAPHDPAFTRGVIPGPAPASARGKKTRARLLDAAAVVFARDGFVNARITDIADEARVAHGTFYTYFQSKEEVLREVALHVQQVIREEILAARKTVPSDATPSDRIYYANLHFLESYRRHARIIGTIDQVATFNVETREIRRDARAQFIDRTRRGIERLTEQGLADPGVDSTHLANALGSMVERCAFIWFGVDEPHELSEAARTLTAVWTRAIRLPDAEVTNLPVATPTPRRAVRRPRSAVKRAT